MDATAEDRYIILSEEVRRLLAENNIDLSDILSQTALDPKEVRQVSNPATPAAGAKEAVTLILASAAAVAALTPLLTKLVSNYTHRPVVVEDTELAPVLDGEGKPVVRPSGEPVLQWQRKKRLLEPQHNSQQSKSTIKGFGIQITVE